MNRNEKIQLLNDMQSGSNQRFQADFSNVSTEDLKFLLSSFEEQEKNISLTADQTERVKRINNTVKWKLI